MLALPERHFSRSVNAHNVDIIALHDWIEASAAFLGEAVSKAEVVDILCEEGVYAEQDFASERVDEAWQLLRDNAAALGPNSLVRVEGRRVVPNGPWTERPATALALALSLAPLYASLRGALQGDYPTQGALFERVAHDALRAKGWTVHPTGWQAGMEALAFDALVEGVQQFLYEPTRAPAAAGMLTAANDAGLDLVCLWSFNDQRPASPAMMVQCASGANWRDKLHTPSPDLWRQLINFIVVPTKAIAIPFLLDHSAFHESAMRLTGVLLDRLRLFRDLGAPDTWLKDTTKQELVAWLPGKVSALETAA